MNAKTARKIRKHLQTIPFDKRKEAEVALKQLWKKGYVRFGK